MEHRRAILPDPAGLCGLVVFLVLAVSSGAKALRDGDTLWHIKFGSLMLERGEILTHDTFSHTAYGQPWLAHEWLSEVIMAALHGWAGLPGVALFYFAVVGLTFTLLFKTASRLAGDGPALAAVAIALPFAMTHLLARPHIFTWLGAALTLFLLVRGGRSLWLLIPLTALWANLHGGVLLGLALQAIFIAADLLDRWPGRIRSQWKKWLQSEKRPLIILGLSALALGLNPFGFKLVIFPLLVSNKLFAAEIGEWQSPNFQTMWYLRLWMVGVFMAAAWRNELFVWRWRLLAIFLVWQAFGHVRHVSLAVMLLTPGAALVCQDLAARMPKLNRGSGDESHHLPLSCWSGPLLTTVCCSMLIIFLAFAPMRWRQSGDRLFPLPHSYSQGAIDYLKQGVPGQRLFNHYEWGDFLLFGLEAPPRVFIDGRADMYGERIFGDYVKMARLLPGSDQLFAQYDIDWILFPNDHQLVRTLQID